jgi:hypothetical protein
MHLRLALSAALVPLLLACTQDTKPTYYADVSPILQRSCVGCHSEGNIAPFHLTSLEEVLAVKELVKSAVVSRSMPPSNIDGSGDCQDFREDKWLTDDEIALIEQWVDGESLPGAPEDEPVVDTPALTLAGSPGAVDLVMPEAYLPGPSEEHPNDDYRCFMFSETFAEDTFLTAYEVLPDQAQQFHHMILFAVTNDEAEAAVDAKLGADGSPGFSCFDSGDVDDAVLLGVWAPGVSVTRYPEGTGIEIPAGHRLGMQVHYNLLNGVAPDRSALRVEVGTDVKPAALSPLVHDDFELEPGQASVFTSASYPLFTYDLPALEVHGVFPHMHLLGRTLRFERFLTTRPDIDECLVDVPRWDFEWQETNFYKEPVIITREDTLRITCEFDTRDRTEPVLPGDGTLDEMCLVFSYITIPDGSDPNDL